MFRSAEEKFSQALKFATDDLEKNFISINMARVCTELGNYDQAIKLLRNEETEL